MFCVWDDDSIQDEGRSTGASGEESERGEATIAEGSFVDGEVEGARDPTNNIFVAEGDAADRAGGYVEGNKLSCFVREDIALDNGLLNGGSHLLLDDCVNGIKQAARDVECLLEESVLLSSQNKDECGCTQFFLGGGRFLSDKREGKDGFLSEEDVWVGGKGL